ncbi:antichymotrypsin-1-like isoform X3 [Spodoptera litura]|uniref:Antichymotrypsin-1-like isoform X3 n=1 Tax=Spodoptera litura TaxID=69820 RepID=A0A9J7EWR0_SPOLT|nr:antichymotrypsin-1-like isoform X3 [Spodoptera litura]
MDKLILILGLVTLAVASPFDFDFGFGRNYVETPLGKSIDTATLKLLKEAYNAAEDKNVVSSPLSLMILLSLFNSGAGPETKQEISRYLGGADFESAYRDLSVRFADLNPNALTVANKVYVASKYNLKESFAFAVQGYRSEVDKLDFSNKDAAAAAINQWANEKTKGNIKDPVKPSMLSEDVAAALFNVIYFKGHWHVPFKAEDTQDKDFHVSKDQVVKKPTMRLTQSLFYAESPELGARLVELPYKETGFRMVIVLPNEIDGLPSVLEKASQKGLLDDVFKLQPAGSDVELELPKFDVKTKLDFNELLPKLGVSKLFEEPALGVVKDQSVVVSKAFQEAFIKVDEEGATAGAFTGLIAVGASLNYNPPPPPQFIVDHPFLYLILYEDKIIFAGTYTH